MIVILGVILGALSGGTIAYKRKGTRMDIAQYAFVYALVFALIGLFITLIIHRMSV